MSKAITLGGRNALVVGGTGDLGSGIVRALADAGCGICLTYSANASSATRLVEAIGGSAPAAAVHVDVTNEKSVEDCVAAARAQLGSIDILAYAAGFHPASYTVRDMPTDTWARILSVNLDGAFLFCRALVPDLVKSPAGRIVILSSIFGVETPALRSAYGAAKHGVIGLVQCLAGELGPSGVTVNAVAPGPCETRMVHDIWEKTAAATGVSAAAYRDSILRTIPLRRLGTAEDIGNLVAFLCSDLANYISGTVLRIAGGA